MTAFTEAFAAFQTTERETQAARDAYRAAAKAMLEPVILDVVQAYAITEWSFSSGDGYNDEGRSWQEFSHYLEVDQDDVYLEESSADSFRGVLYMLKETDDCREVNPRQIELTQEQEDAVDAFLSSPDFLFSYENGKLTWDD